MGDEREHDWATRHARHNDRETSKAAARSMRSTAGGLCARILSCLKTYGPGTFEQVAVRLNLRPDQVWKRLSDLNGRIVADGTAIGSSGREITKWRAL